MVLRRIEIVEDRSASSRCDEGFLRVARLRLRNWYEDGSSSEPYACDVVSRPGTDAVVAVLYRQDGGGAQHPASVRVFLRENLRPPIYLRRDKALVHPDLREYDQLEEVIAGILEAGDGPGPEGLRRRARLEAHEEAGFLCAEDAIQPLGEGQFASPGTSDEKVFYTAASVTGAKRIEPAGDGSVMEEVGRVVERELCEAIAACRTGAIPDMKTEVALLRLADALGYIPQLGCYAHELPAPLRARYRPPGVVPLEAAGDRPGFREPGP